jgi:hypothetical protein
MVHGLNTIRRLNDEAVKKARGKKPTARRELPKGVGLSPATLRRFTNRPWTKAELGGEQDVFKSYAASVAEPFNGKGEREGLRP